MAKINLEIEISLDAIFTVIKDSYPFVVERVTK